MLTESHKFVTAYFVDSERHTIQVEWQDPESDAIQIEYLQFNEEDASYKHLLKFTTLENIHAKTKDRVKEQREAYLATVKYIAEQENLVYLESSDGIFKKFNSILFDDNIDSEILFKAKLVAFEIQFVKDCKDKTLKSKLRKAETIAETYSVLFEIQAFMSEQTDGDKQVSE
jgi:hypothetical protein